MNPEAVRMKVDRKNNETRQTVTIREFYYQIHYPITDIEVFKKAINAAADLNKAVLK